MELKVESSEDMSDLNAKFTLSKAKQMQSAKIDKLLATGKARSFSTYNCSSLNYVVEQLNMKKEM